MVLRMARWPTVTPFGLAVDPDVYMTYAASWSEMSGSGLAGRLAGEPADDELVRFNSMSSTKSAPSNVDAEGMDSTSTASSLIPAFSIMNWMVAHGCWGCIGTY